MCIHIYIYIYHVILHYIASSRSLITGGPGPVTDRRSHLSGVIGTHYRGVHWEGGAVDGGSIIE